MQLVNFDAMMHVFIRAINDLHKLKRDDLAGLVRFVAQELQNNLDEIAVEVCPICGERFDGGIKR